MHDLRYKDNFHTRVQQRKPSRRRDHEATVFEENSTSDAAAGASATTGSLTRDTEPTDASHPTSSTTATEPLPIANASPIVATPVFSTDRAVGFSQLQRIIAHQEDEIRANRAEIERLNLRVASSGDRTSNYVSDTHAAGAVSVPSSLDGNDKRSGTATRKRMSPLTILAIAVISLLLLSQSPLFFTLLCFEKKVRELAVETIAISSDDIRQLTETSLTSPPTIPPYTEIFTQQPLLEASLPPTWHLTANPSHGLNPQTLRTPRPSPWPTRSTFTLTYSSTFGEPDATSFSSTNNATSNYERERTRTTDPRVY